MLGNSKMKTSVTRKVLIQHCIGVGRGKMHGGQNFPTLMAKVVRKKIRVTHQLFHSSFIFRGTLLNQFVARKFI